MSDKKGEKGKPSPKAAKKALDNKVIAQALKVTYIASCRALDIKPQKTLTSAIDVAMEDGKKVVDKIAFRDHMMGALGVRSICDVLAGYSLCQNLGFFHCNVGEAGVEALCDLLRSSAGSWSKASKIRLLEITGDFDVPLLEPYPFIPPEQPPVLDNLPDEGGPVKLAKVVDPISELNKVVVHQANFLGLPAPPEFVSNELFSTCTAQGRLTRGALDLLGSTLAIDGIHLRVLVLDHNGIGDGGALALCQGLIHSASLSTLSLAYNEIGHRGGAGVAKLLWPQAACRVKLLNMQGNLLGDKGLIDFARAVGASSDIKALILAGNRMGGSGTEESMEAVKCLCGGITANASLMRVDLNGNFFSDDHVREFLPMLAGKPELKQFRLSPARMSRQLSEEMANIISKHNTKKKKGGGKKKKKKKK